MEDIVNKELEGLIESFKAISIDHPKYYQKLVDEYTYVANSLKNNDDILELSSGDNANIIVRKKLLEKTDNSKRNYFTISSKDSFSDFPSKNIENSWGKSLIYYPLNDHSRDLLKKGDVLYCYRQGQFSDLNSALLMRGIYAIGIAASDPVLLFPKAENHNKWGVLVCFPIVLPNHLELKNIQMHPETIDLTPYNGNRNDALQYISDSKHYLTLLNMLYSRNIEISEKFKLYFSDVNLIKLILPDKLFTDFYNTDSSLLNLSIKPKPNNLIIDKFVEWFYKTENYRKSYEGLVTVKILNFWNECFFKNSLFAFDYQNINNIYIEQERIIFDKNNLEWKRYSESSSKGAPEAVMGKNNYLRFLHEFLSDPFKLNLLKNSKPSSIYKKPNININFNLDSFYKCCNDDVGLRFDLQFIQRFIASLLTKPFVICSGLSGSGKTKLAQAFVLWICESENQYKIIPVGADWTNREPLLGYPNGLDPKSYVTPDSGALQLIIEASREENQNKPYFMILDEMNLSHVERYFADFLSIMESKEKLKLYSGEKRYSQFTKENDFDEQYLIPYEIEWPTNLFIIGTVNIDETTYMFSPKVLDRANVIEFRITPKEMDKFIKERKELNMKELFLDKDKSKGGAGQNTSENFLILAQNKEITKIQELEGNDNILNKFFEELQIVGSEFGYRSATEIELLITKLGIGGFVDDKGQPLINNTKIDIAIMQKLLPKLHGSRKKIVGPLEILAGFCLVRIKSSMPEEKNKKMTVYQQFIAEERNSERWEIKYPISFEKIERMHKNVIDNGFTSYAEA
jgi:5-methylcytosine-specific restriction protein B